MNNARALRIIVSAFIGIPFFLIFPLHADLPLTEVYGLYDGVYDQYKHLSPFHGFVVGEKEILRNYYEFAPNKDPMAVLVKELFYLDGNTFKRTTSPTKVITKFTPHLIGKLLAVIEANLDRATARITVTPEQLKKILISTLNQDISSTKLADFIRFVINALKAAGQFNPEEQIYPQYLMHDILLTFLYKKISNKNEYKEYFDAFKGIKEINNGQGILKENQDWWPLRYEQPDNKATQTAEILRPLLDERLLNTDVKILLFIMQHYESVGYAIINQEIYGGKYPRYTPYSKALLRWFKENPLLQNNPAEKTQYAFADCMETALRNLFNVILFNHETKRFDLLPLDENAPLKHYYARFSIKEMRGDQAHNAWADLLANIPGVLYLKRARIKDNKIEIEESATNFERPQQDDGWFYYEVDPQTSNVILVINVLLNTHFKNLEEFAKAFNLTCQASTQMEEGRVEKCIITTAQEKQCTLSIKPRHAQTTMEEKIKQQITNKVGDILENAIVKSAISNKRSLLFLPLINLFTSTVVGSNNLNEKNAPFLMNNPYFHHLLLSDLFLLGQFSTVSACPLCDFIMTLVQVPEWASDSWYNQLCEKISQKIFASNDYYVIHNLMVQLNTLAEFGGEKLKPWPTMRTIIEQAIDRDIKRKANPSARQAIRELIKNQNFWGKEWLKDMISRFRDGLAEDLIIKHLTSPDSSEATYDFNWDAWNDFYLNRELYGIDWIKKLLLAHKNKLGSNTRKSLIEKFFMQDPKAWGEEFIKEFRE